MTREQLSSRICAIIAAVIEVPAEDVQPTSRFHADLTLDDFDWIEMLIALGDEYEVEISDEDSEAFRSVADIIDHLARRLGLLEAAA